MTHEAVIHRVSLTCPECGYVLDSHVAMGLPDKPGKLRDRAITEGPRDGDCAVCAGCRKLLRFTMTDDGMMLFTLMEMDEVMEMVKQLTRQEALTMIITLSGIFKPEKKQEEDA